MKRSILAILLLGILGFGALVSAQHNQADEESLRNIVQQWVSSFNAGDASEEPLYTDDAVLHDALGATHEGREAVMTHWQDLRDIDVTRVESDVIEVEAFGDTAYAITSFVFTTTEGDTFGAGKFMFLLRRTDGEWQIYRQLAQIPPPAPEAQN